MKRSTLFFVVFFISAVSLFAQEEQDSTQTVLFPRPTRNGLNTLFNKELNIYSLTTKLDYSHSFGMLNLRVNEELNSNFLKYSGDNSKRDENRLKLSGDYRLSNYINPGFLISGKLYSDSRTSDISTAASNFGVLFNKMMIEDLVSVLPFAGYIEDVQSGVSNNGLIYGFQGGIEQRSISDFIIGSSFQFKNEDISPRKNTIREFVASVGNNFNPGVENSFAINYKEAGRDFFFDADSTLQNLFSIEKNQQRRNDRIISVSDAFNYSDFIQNTSLLLRFNFSDRLVERTTLYRDPRDLYPTSFDSQIEELKFDIGAGLNYLSDFADLKLTATYSERTEKFLLINPGKANPDYFELKNRNEAVKNNIASQFFLSTTGSIFITENDRLELNLSHYKLRYDTPSNENIDERDELLSQFRVKYIKALNSSLSLFAGFDFSYGKLVYILAARSSNNNTNRIFKLNTGYSYLGKGFRNFGNFEIIANYLVYDFEDLNPGFKSFSFRQISLSDSLSLAVANNLFFEVTGFFKLSEQGDLKWSEHKIKPAREITEILVLPALLTKIGDYSFKLGVRYYSYFSDAIVNEERKQDNFYKGIAPLAEISADFFDAFRLSLKGWYEIIDSKGNPKRYLTTLNLNAKWLL
ncbi:MAG: hypothetical protein LC102_12410 [Ignavibacteriales bacterium]|nr:MAG: hypothetical protein F9K26_00735 [Ignavibacteriaceae bacterium]MBW7871935.1 hypothetical protein [Ignavibacteria bacterium]MCZ2144214.1 hypothetical protein [Ignavibacteriales bacterium]OQY79011.1 MAG: hypothetical protein B6D45_01590 [Ignavibacteriales bacterium UTCHB3]MBV6446168.1 hypothetical protein [Ignavibacteriaceae bacterium]